MPTYTYECKKCHKTFEEFHAISANPKVRCTECNAVCRRLLGTGAGIIFKGSGFYETDYKRKPAAAGSTSGGNGSTGGDKSESKSDSKPSGKGETSKAKASKD